MRVTHTPNRHTVLLGSFSAWGQGACWALPAASTLPRASVEGSGLRGDRSVWDQAAKREQRYTHMNVCGGVQC